MNATGEEIENFSEKFFEKFSQAYSKKPAQKRKEHSSTQKNALKLDPSHTKIDCYLEIFYDTIQLSTSSFGFGTSDSTHDHSPSSPELRHSTRDHSPSSPELCPSKKRRLLTDLTDDSSGSTAPLELKGFLQRLVFSMKNLA